MIPEKIQAFFNFIDYLHDNKSKFLKQTDLVDEIKALDKKRNDLLPVDNYKKRLAYNEIEKEINQKFEHISTELIYSMQEKATNLKIYNPDNIAQPINYGRFYEENNQLKESFNPKDLPIILDKKRKYIDFRAETNSTYFQDIFFLDLDRTLKELFDYFKDTDSNEFAPFEQRTVKVDSLEEALNIISGKPIEEVKEIDKELLKELSNTSLARSVQIVHNRYTNKNALELFVSEFSDWIKTSYSDLLLNITKDDLYKIIKLYEDQEWELPTLKISEYEYQIIKHFIRDIKGFKVATSVYGFGKGESDFMSVIYLDYELLNNIHKIDFFISLNEAQQIKYFQHLANIKTELNKYLGIEENDLSQPQQSENPQRTYTVKHHVLAYILDCFANGKKYEKGMTNEDFEKMGKKRMERKGFNKSGNSFRKAWDRFTGNDEHDFNNSTFLNATAGNEWRSIVLELSENREALESYLKGKGL